MHARDGTAPACRRTGSGPLPSTHNRDDSLAKGRATFMHPLHRGSSTRSARSGTVGARILLALALAAIAQVLAAAPAGAQTSADSSVVVQWTAPGDDGNVGRATTYQLRYRTSSVSGTDTTSWWNA